MLPELFCEKMKGLLGEEYEAFLAALDRPRAVGLRLNPLKFRHSERSEEFLILNSQFLTFHLTPVPWCPTGYFYDEATRPGLCRYAAFNGFKA